MFLCVSMRSLIVVAVRSSLILNCMLNRGINSYLVKYARVSRMPDITLSFNASDDEGVMLRSFSVFDLSD